MKGSGGFWGRVFVCWKKNQCGNIIGDRAGYTTQVDFTFISSNSWNKFMIPCFGATTTKCLKGGYR